MIYKVFIIIIIVNLKLYGQSHNNFSPRPNVLFIIVDDLRPELNCFGEKKIISPNIDYLSRTGQLFTNAYANFPSCGPSRASILSGLYPSKNRFVRNYDTVDDELKVSVSLPKHFRNNNYKTISLGKVFHDFSDGKGSWDTKWRPYPTETIIFDYQSDNSISIFEEENEERYKYEYNESPKFSRLPNRGPAFESADVKDVAYTDGRIATRAIEELQDLEKSSDRFFMVVGFQKPHLPFNAPSKYWDLYDQEDIKLAMNNYRPENAPDESMHNYGELRAYHGIPKEGPIPDSLARNLRHAYYSCVSYIDRQVGRILNSLQSLGIEENTIIVLWGDHGWQLGEHSLWAKHANFRTSLQVPLIFKIPGKKSGIQQRGLVESVDIYPTLCDLVGIDKPFHLQGKSFVTLFDNPENKGKEAVFCRSGLGGETIITKKYSYTEFFDSEGRFKSNMLYDLSSDPEENINISGEKNNKGIIDDLSNALKIHLGNRDKILLNR